MSALRGAIVNTSSIGSRITSLLPAYGAIERALISITEPSLSSGARRVSVSRSDSWIEVMKMMDE